MEHLHEVKNVLTEHSKVGGKEQITADTEKLQSDWTSAVGVSQNSRDNLLGEHNDWVQGLVREMQCSVQKGEELLRVELSFVEKYPLDSILDSNAESLLEEVKGIVADLEVGVVYLAGGPWVHWYTVPLIQWSTGLLVFVGAI